MYVNWYATYKIFGTTRELSPSEQSVSGTTLSDQEGKPQPLGNALFLRNLVDFLHPNRIFIQDFVTGYQLIQLVFHGVYSIALTCDGESTSGMMQKPTVLLHNIPNTPIWGTQHTTLDVFLLGEDKRVAWTCCGLHYFVVVVELS
jgi:hypothetical protein